MRYFSAVLVFCAAAVLMSPVSFGQNRPYTSVGGYGNVVYPGVGHAPGAAIGNSYRSGYHGGYGAAGVNHQAHGRTAVVPYPVIVGGYYGYPNSYYDPSQGAPQGYVDNGAGGYAGANPNAAPSVVINQAFIPDRANPMVQNYPNGPEPPDQGMHEYNGLQTGPQGPQARTDQPTLYLIAFKDSHIVPALGYWVEDGTLHYVSAEHTLNQASMDLIDRDMSQRLNDERGVEFHLPVAR